MYITDKDFEDKTYVSLWLDHLDSYESSDNKNMHTKNRYVNWLIIAHTLGRMRAYDMMLDDMNIPKNLTLKEALTYHQLIGD